MDYLHTIIMGFMQGLTEFLPVSSSGHIVLTSAIYKLITGQDFTVAGEQETFFDIILHIGTLIAVCIYFRRELIAIFAQFFRAIKAKSFTTYRAMLPAYIFVGTFFTAIVVLPIADFCENMIAKPYLVGFALIITGGILLLSEFLSKKIADKKGEVDLKKSILIGIAQGLAACPGISRSGTTIAMALGLGIDRVNAAKYSFLLSIPIIILAALKEIPEIAEPHIFEHITWMPILAGTIVAGVVGYFCIKFFIAYLKRFSLSIFAYYCFIAGIATCILFNYLV